MNKDIENLIANKQFRDAKTIILEELKNNENDLELLKNLGLCQVNLEDYPNAQKTFAQIIEQKSDDATAYFYSAFLNEKLKNKELAIVHYQKVIELREHYIDAYKNLASLYIQEKMNEEADKLLQKLYEFTKKENTDCTIPFLYANTQVLLNNTDKAIELLQEALTLNDKHIQSLNTLGCLYMAQSKYDESFELYQKSLNIDDKNATTHFNIGTWYMIKQDFKKAKEHFALACKYQETVQHLAQLGLAQMKDLDFPNACATYQKLCTLLPVSLTFKFNYALCLYETKQYTQAISILLPIVQQNPKSAVMAHKLALCFRELGQIKNSALIFERILKLGKIPAEIYLDYANLLLLDNDTQHAEKILKKLLQINPKLAQAHKDLGVIYLLQRLFEEAKECFDKAIELAPQNPYIVFEYANYYQAISEFSEAEKYYEKANKLLPNQENICLMFGLNQIKLNKLEKAKEFLAQVLAINPQSLVALTNLAQISFANQNFELAKEYLTDAYTIEANTNVTNLLAMTYMELNDYHNAKVLLNRLNNEIPNNTNILTTLAKAEMLDNNPQMAKSYLEQAIAIFPELEEAQELLQKLS